MPDLYEYPGAVQEILNEEKTSSEVERITFDRGIEIYLKGEKYPVRGLPTAEALVAINLAKKTLLELTRILVSPPFILGTVVCVVLYKMTYRRAFQTFKRLVGKSMRPFILKKDYQGRTTRELCLFVSTFLAELGISGLYTAWVPLTISHIFEYDTAYRIRLIDIVSETDAARLLAHPRKEIKRLALLAKDRDTTDMKSKYDVFVRLTTLVLLFPPFKKAFRHAIQQVNLHNMQYDNANMYWALKRTDYDALGKTFNERQLILANMI